MKIAVFEIEKWEREAFEPLQDGHDITFIHGPLTAESTEGHTDAEIVSTFIYSDLKREVLESLPDLKLIVTRSTGSDHIDTDYVGMEELLANSDVVTLHVPASEKTHHLISTKQFGQMKKGAILINTARGALVDVQALLRALADGHLAAAGLDVLPEEPAIREEAELLSSLFQKDNNVETLLADHVLLRMRNVYITPHSAFNTREAVQRILDTTVENIRSFAGGEPENVVSSGRYS